RLSFPTRRSSEAHFLGVLFVINIASDKRVAGVSCRIELFPFVGRNIGEVRPSEIDIDLHCSASKPSGLARDVWISWVLSPGVILEGIDRRCVPVSVEISVVPADLNGDPIGRLPEKLGAAGYHMDIIASEVQVTIIILIIGCDSQSQAIRNRYVKCPRQSSRAVVAYTPLHEAAELSDPGRLSGYVGGACDGISTGQRPLRPLENLDALHVVERH